MFASTHFDSWGGGFIPGFCFYFFFKKKPSRPTVQIITPHWVFKTPSCTWDEQIEILLNSARNVEYFIFLCGFIVLMEHKKSKLLKYSTLDAMPP